MISLYEFLVILDLIVGILAILFALKTVLTTRALPNSGKIMGPAVLFSGLFVFANFLEYKKIPYASFFFILSVLLPLFFLVVLDGIYESRLPHYEKSLEEDIDYEEKISSTMQRLNCSQSDLKNPEKFDIIINEIKEKEPSIPILLLTKKLLNLIE